ncbi:unnamed protein product [Mytilus edulis]|uniref:Uncharacterized protein n=1 Tax=Mytilus edulis TaxID=6550 RepID=A0A8S3UGI7_MYTED|nr:unnamed protein product [Mytilus edulis]
MNQKPASLVADMDLFNVVSSFDKPKQQNAQPGDAALSFFNSQPLDNTRKDTNDTNKLAKALEESVNMNRLPVPEPNIFNGDPLQYMEWKTSFEMLIDRKDIPTIEKIFYLKKYVGGAARKALEGYFYNNSQTAYDNTRKVLEESKGHLNKDCKLKHTCNTCKGKLSLCLREERPPVRQQTSNVPDSSAVNNFELKPAISLRVSHNNVQSTSMIVPVWVSHKDKPSREIITYAIIDTQSNTTFILDDTAASLHTSILCEHSRLSLSIMTSQQTVIESKRITGLTVRSFSSPERLNINSAYARGFIPVERLHIPTNETARQWHHL